MVYCVHYFYQSHVHSRSCTSQDLLSVNIGSIALARNFTDLQCIVVFDDVKSFLKSTTRFCVQIIINHDKIVVQRIHAIWVYNKAKRLNDLRFSLFCFTLIALSIRSTLFFHLAYGVDKDFVVAELLSEWRTLCLHIVHVKKYPTVIVNLLSIMTPCIIFVTIVTW